MKEFLDDNFLLQTKTAERLYHDCAADLPIIDYHNHLPPKEIVEDRIFENITQAWLEGDHYKWRAMRANGIGEEFCTGKASDKEKFRKWAETVPYTLRNPLYHWTHLELRRYFGIEQLLNTSSSEEIYHQASNQLQEMGTNILLSKMKVEVVCTTDDPTDSLEYHQRWDNQSGPFKLLPTFRPDKVLVTHFLDEWNQYIDRLAEVSNTEISSFKGLIDALSKRHDYFHQHGCRLSDIGLAHLFSQETSEAELEKAFDILRSGHTPDIKARKQFKTAVLVHLSRMNFEKGWTQQFHLGALRNNSTRQFDTIGRDTGFDSIADFPQAVQLSHFFDILDRNNQLAKTIVYNLNPADNAVFASMVGNFNDGSKAGKMQFGSGWWFLDQKDGIEQQLNTLSNMGLLSRFVGMLTDSRSFLSFPRHEYFRRILCNLLGNDMENGELPNDLDLVGGLVKNVCYYNAKSYFDF